MASDISIEQLLAEAEWIRRLARAQVPAMATGGPSPPAPSLGSDAAKRAGVASIQPDLAGATDVCRDCRVGGEIYPLHVPTAAP